MRTSSYALISLMLAFPGSSLRAAPCEGPGFDPKPWQDAAQPLPDIHDQKLIDFLQKPTRPDGTPASALQSDALLIAYRDKIEVEAYFNGQSATKRHVLWSATKSLFNALVGIAVGDGKLELHRSLADYLPRFPHLQSVTVDDALSFATGLNWREAYEEHILPQQSSVTSLLFGFGSRSIERALLPYRSVKKPGSTLAYSSGDTALLSLLLKSVYGPAAYRELPWKRLFEPLGIHTAVIEADAEGTYYASSSAYMTARDFLRFGSLYLHDGCVGGEALLPRRGSIPEFSQLSWTELSLAPSEALLQQIKTKQPWPDQAGRHFWLNMAPERSGRALPYPHAPANTLIAMGHWGQRLYIIPAWNMVVLRFAHDRTQEFWPEDHFFKQLASWRAAKGLL